MPSPVDPAAPDVRGLGPGRLPGLPPGVAIKLAIGLHRLVRRLADRLIPADLLVFDLAFGVARTAMLAAMARAGIADLLEEGPGTAAELAARAGTDPDATHRMLRALAWERVVRLDGGGRFHATRITRALRAGQVGRSREWAAYFGSPSNQRAYLAFEHTLRTGKNGFEPGNGTGVWAWFEAHPDEREQFAQAMMGLTIHAASTVAELYPWREVGVVCDVGGGRGTLLSELLVRHSHLRGILCDAAGVIASAGPLLRARGVADRVELVAGSFFGELPVGADAYVLKNVLHDWDDARSLEILSSVRRAMRPGQRIVVVEALLGANQLHPATLVDVHMMTVSDEGRERSRAELEALLVAAGFRPARVRATPVVGVLEGIAR